jgi:tetratricopeptide (TPR) repeat protein
VDLVREAGLDPSRDFVGASLKDIDLRGEDLRGFDFTAADLTGADLRGAEVEGVPFVRAILTGAIGLPDALRWTYTIDKLTPEKTLAARRALEGSLAVDPNSAEAWSELAYVLMIDFLRSWNNATQEVVAQAEEAVQKAYAIDPSIALTHLADGEIREVKGDLPGAIEALDRALQLDPYLSLAYAHKANALVLLGRAEEAPALLTKAIDLSPREPDVGMFYWFMGRAYFAMKDYDNAIHWLARSVREKPTTWFSLAYLISAYALTEQLRQPEAQAALHEYRAQFPNWQLDPKIRDYYSETIYSDAPPELNASLQEFFKGLQVAFSLS